LAPFIFNADGTSSYGTNWSQDSCDMQFWFPSGTTYTGNVTSDGTHLSGTMVDYLGAPGCWTADRIDSGTDVPADVPSNNDEPLDIAGNPK
jgi:hypothetical protein